MIHRTSHYRYLSTALALLLFITALALGQNATQGGGTDLHSTNHRVVSTSSAAGTFFGTTQTLGRGTVRSWVTLDKDGKPAAIGVTISEAALKTAPTELPSGQPGVEFNLALPAEAAATAFDHIGFGWNPRGHEPEKIYDVPHFDLHFYTITPAERARITAQGDDLAKTYREPSAEYAPVGYILAPGTAVPNMGAHWINPKAGEFQGAAFTRTFLYGNYDGQIIFYEPMITKAFLETQVNVAEHIKLPAKYAKPGYYPTRYSIKYDPVNKEYVVALEGMVLR